MSNYSVKIDLLKLDGATLQTNAQGKMAVIIPVEEADLFVGRENKAVYLDLSMWETPRNPYGDSHSLKKSYSQARREMLGADAVKAKPYVGNAREIKPRASENPQPGMMQAQPPTGFDIPQNNDYPF